MINIEKVIKYLEKNEKQTFEEIWKVNRELFIDRFKDFDEMNLKTDVHLSLSNDERVLLTFDENGQQIFDLVKRYSYSDINKIKSKILGEVFDKQLDENSETDDTVSVQVNVTDALEENKT